MDQVANITSDPDQVSAEELNLAFAEFKAKYEKDLAEKLDARSLLDTMRTLNKYGLLRAHHDTMLMLCEILGFNYVDIKRAGIEKYKNAPRDRFGALRLR